MDSEILLIGLHKDRRGGRLFVFNAFIAIVMNALIFSSIYSCLRG